MILCLQVRQNLYRSMLFREALFSRLFCALEAFFCSGQKQLTMMRDARTRTQLVYQQQQQQEYRLLRW